MKKLSVILLGTLLCICIALLPMETQAAETEGYLTYIIEDGEVTITDCDEDASGKIVIPDTIEGYPVTKLREYAFHECTGIKEIVVPEGFTVIPTAAFADCETLTKVTLPKGLTSIEKSAFSGCEALTSIDIPESVTSIGGGAFRFCRKLSAITIPNGIQEIKDSTFVYCNSLTDVTIPESVTTIGAEAFSGCPLSEDFVLPKNISSIGDGAFGRGCGITIPEDHPYFTVDEYGVLFNRDKTKLVLALSPIKGKYEVPEGVQTIQGYAFAGCQAMTEIVFPNTVTEMGSYALCSIGAASVRLPEGLTVVESGLLATCKNLVSVHIPDSVTRIESEAFRFCYELRNIRLSDNLQYIGEWAFQSVYMEKLSLPASLQEIAKGAFSECNSLISVYYYGNHEQWTAIKLGEHNEELREERWHSEHRWDEGTMLRESTCSQNGERILVCQYCNEEMREFLPRLKHSCTAEWFSNESKHWLTCKDCGYKQRWLNHIPGPEATVDAPQTCTVCGYEIAPKLEKEEPIYWIWIAVGAVILAGGATAAVIILKKKRQ